MKPLLLHELELRARAKGWSLAEISQRLGFKPKWYFEARAGRVILTTLALSRILRQSPGDPRIRQLLEHYLTVEFPEAIQDTPTDAVLLDTLSSPAQATLRTYLAHFAYEHLEGRGLWCVSPDPGRLAAAVRYLVAGGERDLRTFVRVLPNETPTDPHALLAAQLVLFERLDRASPTILESLRQRLAIRLPVVVTSLQRDLPSLDDALRTLLTSAVEVLVLHDTVRP